MSKRLDIPIGTVFGRLTVIEELPSIKPKNHSKERYLLCKCSCNGNEKPYRLGSLTQKPEGTKSCGCYQKEQMSKAKTIHGMSYNELYGTHQRMMDRCYNKNAKVYKNYGGRGIKVCDEWHVVDHFIEDVKEIYIPGLTMDRKDNNGNYCKENVKWSTSKEQGRNKRNNLIFEYNGEYKCLSEICEMEKKEYYAVKGRIRCGWSLEDALNIPVKSRKKKGDGK